MRYRDRVAGRAVRYAGGAVAAIVVRPGLLEKLGLGAEHLENMVNFDTAIERVLAEAASVVMALEPLDSDEDDFFLENGWR